MIINTNKLKRQIEKRYDQTIKEQQKLKHDENCDLSEEKFRELNNLSIWHLSKIKFAEIKKIELVEELAKQFPVN